MFSLDDYEYSIRVDSFGGSLETETNVERVLVEERWDNDRYSEETTAFEWMGFECSDGEKSPPVGQD